MNKCEWKDGEFEGCDSAKTEYRKELKMLVENEDIGFFCKWCGADIRKPEPKVIIKRSGGTWIIWHRDIDFIVLDPELFIKQSSITFDNYKTKTWITDSVLKHIADLEIIKPIKDIEITDEIALLRPMVIIQQKDNVLGIEEDPRMLTFIDYEIITTKYMVCGRDCVKSIRLATTKDLP